MSERINVPDIFGSLVFNDEVMRKRLPKDTYEQLNKHIEERTPLTFEIAQEVATVMKSWAVEKVQHTLHTGSSQ